MLRRTLFNHSVVAFSLFRVERQSPIVQLREERARVDRLDRAFQAVVHLSLLFVCRDTFLGCLARVWCVDQFLLVGLLFIGPVFGVFFCICFKLSQLR